MKNNLIRLLLLSIISIAAISATALPQGYYAKESLLASGRWVKISTDTTGIYEISYDELRSWGFADPTKVAVYGYGSIMTNEHAFSADYPDDLIQTPTLHTTDGRVLFYSEGDIRCATDKSNNTSSSPKIAYDRNHYDSHTYYYLTDSRKIRNINTRKYVSTGSQVHQVLKWHYCIDLIEREVQNIGNGGVFYHGQQLQPGETEYFAYQIRDYYTDSSSDVPNGYFIFDAKIKTPKSTRLLISASENIGILTNRTNYCTTTSSDVCLYCSNEGRASFTSTTDKPLDNTSVTFGITLPSDFAGSYAAIDKAFVVYPRRNTLAQCNELQLKFNRAISNQNFELFDVDETTEVWNVTDPKSIFRYALAYDSDTHSAKASFTSESVYESSRIIAFNPSKRHRSVKFLEELANQNVHGYSAPDMLIISNRMCMEAAEELAQIHRDIQGLDVLVVPQDIIFNEFSSGSKHPAGLRRLVKMLYNRDQEKFKYLLLYGTSTWDNRGIVKGRTDDIVSYQVEILDQARETTTNYCSDQYFGMLSDNFTPGTMAYSQIMHIGVGRIPAPNLSVARQVNEKIRRHLLAPTTVREYLNTVILSDIGDGNSHFVQAGEAVDSLITRRPEITTVRADLELYTTKIVQGMKSESESIVRNQLKAGCGYLSFCGHGNNENITSISFYDRPFVKNNNYTTLPLAMLSTCAVYPFDQRSFSLAEDMLYQPEGGAIGVIASCRTVYLDFNRMFNNCVAATYAAADDNTCIGDIIPNARLSLIDNYGGLGGGLGYNTLCYNLCGDPAIPLGAPKYRIEVNMPSLVNCNTATTISGTITTRDGGVVTDFNGYATIDVYDKPTTLTNLNNGKLSAVADQTIIGTYITEVVDGRFNADVALPQPSAGDGLHRIVVTAIDSETNAQAAGMASGIAISDDGTGYAADIDTSAPTIEALYLNTPDFKQGDVVAPQFTITAVVAPGETGITTNNLNIVPKSSLVLDGTVNYSDAIATLSPDGSGKLRFDYTVSSLDEGRHTLTLKMLNNAGKSSEATIEFSVAATVEGSLTIEEDSPVRSIATFDFDSKGYEITPNRLLIVDHTGATVVSRENVSFPFQWDLTTDSGTLVSDGCYQAFVLFDTASTYGSSNRVELIVIKDSATQRR